MLHILEYTYWNLALVFLAGQTGQPVLELLHTRKLNMKRITPENWQEVTLALSSSEDIFGTVDETLLVDCSKLSLVEPSVDFWKSLSSYGDVFLYRSADPMLNAADRKNLKTAGALFHTFKTIDTATARTLATEQNSQLSRPLSTEILEKIISKSSHYDEILDAIDYLSLTNDASNHIDDVFISEQPALFMMPFRPLTHPQDIQFWAHIPEDDLQFALAIIGSKLTKNRSDSNNEILKELINTDFAMKSPNILSAFTLWKLFLWKAKNQ